MHIVVFDLDLFITAVLGLYYFVVLASTPF